MSQLKSVFVRTALRTAAALSISVATAFMFAGNGAAETAIAIKYHVVETSSYSEPFLFDGVVEPYDRAHLSAKVDGIVERISIQNGSHVGQGDVVIELDDSVRKLELERAYALLDEFQAQLNQKKLALEREAQLRERKVTASARLQAAQTEHDMARAKVAIAQATVHLAEQRLSYTKIRAPISGRVNLTNLAIGSYVEAEAGKPLGTIFNTDPVLVVYQVPFDARLQILSSLGEKTDDEFKRRAKLELILSNGVRYHGTGTHLYSSGIIDPVRNTMTVAAVFPNKSGTLLPGAKPKVSLEIHDPDPVLSVVPSEAVWLDGQDPQVLVVDRVSSRLEARDISVIRYSEKSFVATGVYGGETIALHANNELRAGMLVVAAEE